MDQSPLLVATHADVFRLEGAVLAPTGLPARPTCLAADPHVPGRAFCGTRHEGVLRTDDSGTTWRAVGLERRSIMSVAVSPAAPGLVWVGTEPSEVWRSQDAGETWDRTRPLATLPSAPTWAFPPRPDTHHVRWIACHPEDAGRLWVAIEAGALVSTRDGGATWQDRVPGGPYDTHELAIHPAAPETLRVSAGDGYLESHDGGAGWTRPAEGLEVGYLRSVTVDPGDPETVLVSAASSPRSAYVAGRSDGRVYRRVGGGPWARVHEGWPDAPTTIAPLLAPGTAGGELWAADERGVHRSGDGGRTWRQVAAFDATPDHLRGLAPL